MRGHCIICAELFVADSEISAVTCGHTFHYLCLTQWTERSKTCPQCRIRLTTKSVIPKLYFDAGPDLEPEEDPDALRNRNNDLESTILAKSKEIARLRQVVEGQVELNEVMEKNNATCKDKLKKEKDLTASLKIQLECLSSENKRFKLLEKENVLLTNKLQECKSMEVILNGSDAEANRILKSHGSGSAHMDQLVKFCSVLKSELSSISVQKGRLATKLKYLEQEKSTLKKEINRLRNAEKEEEAQCTDRRVKFLQQKLIDIKRELNQCNEKSDTNWLDVPPEVPKTAASSSSSSSSAQPVASNKENDSPMVAQRSVAASIAMAKDKKPSRLRSAQPSAKVEAEMYKHFSIMTRNRQVPSKGKLSSAVGSSGSTDHGYDGLGGHSRPEVFPSGSGISKRKIKVTANRKVSRPKTTNSNENTIIID